MIQQEALWQVLDALDALEVPYMLVGSFASNYWGRPRMTHDADVLLHYSVDLAVELGHRLQQEFYVSDEALREAAVRHGHANVIHLREAFKVDLWACQPEPYDRERLGRRHLVVLSGRSLWVSSAEDVILAKLNWYRQWPSERQLRDALEVYEIQHASLDQGYLDRWAVVLGVVDLLRQIRTRASLPDVS